MSKFCLKCGNQCSDDDVSCSRCGKKFIAQKETGSITSTTKVATEESATKQESEHMKKNFSWSGLSVIVVVAVILVAFFVWEKQSKSVMGKWYYVDDSNEPVMMYISEDMITIYVSENESDLVVVGEEEQEEQEEEVDFSKVEWKQDEDLCFIIEDIKKDKIILASESISFGRNKEICYRLKKGKMYLYSSFLDYENDEPLVIMKRK